MDIASNYTFKRDLNEVKVVYISQYYLACHFVIVMLRLHLKFRVLSLNFIFSIVFNLLYLFVTAAEALAIAIRQNPDIKGIVFGKEEMKVLQYPDDTTATLVNKDSAKSLFKLMEIFQNISGLSINSSKMEGMWIGSLGGKIKRTI